MKSASYGLGLALSCFSLSVCAATSAPDAEQAIAAAEQANSKAAAVDYEWRDTGKLLKQAKAALAKGDNEHAIKLAKQARLFSEAGYQQAQAQQNAGPRF
ncbi:hypothetical protein [Candidatus Venteria ishoeyi]|uniref:SoxXA-binding protein SoxK n=1 Tax=Candidatus Venteria ishoeyi TaxID=1899563 RepID=A0A1H6FHK2_9GAMM|nr:hypothetical protein [Candidatus Venteria ishoeyi]MDM8546449.1 hypothetical protein [Candidatus Venteria ishoeyi]SEH08484.1 Uncharacterised protein [Candidatus Venteria ishoeyi]